VVSFTTDLANALAPFNINVNCILPGPVKTNFYDSTIGAMPKEQQEPVWNMLAGKRLYSASGCRKILPTPRFSWLPRWPPG